MDDNIYIDFDVGAPTSVPTCVPTGAPISPLLIPPSQEQLAVVEAVAAGNVIVDAVAGSGKTTTVLHIARTYADEAILLLTYNSKLRLETRSRAEDAGLHNLSVHTYHSYCLYECSSSCKNDAEMMALVYDTTGAKRMDFAGGNPTQYGIVIIDEAQDMTRLYYDVALCAIGNSQKPPKLIVMGDRNQSIYGYAGADPRYITLADEKFPSPYPWQRRSLRTSYRITRQMAACVNTLISIGNDDPPVLQAVKDGPIPTYLYGRPRDLVRKIVACLATCTPDDIFILSASARMHRAKNGYPGPVLQIAEMLSRPPHGIPVYMPLSDNASPSVEVTAGKIVFCSFHQSKGRERKHVFVLGFDEGYERNMQSITKYPNTLYVALTRAKETLTVFHNCDKQAIPLLPNPIPPVLHVILGDKMDQPRRNDTHYKVTCMFRSVCDLIRHTPSHYMKAIMDTVRRVTITPASDNPVKIPPVCRQMARGGVYHEEVSDVTGHATVATYEMMLTPGRCEVFNTVRRLKEYEKFPLQETAPSILGASLGYSVYHTHAKHRQVQITQYNWATMAQLTQCAKNIRDAIKDNVSPVFELPVALVGDFDPLVSVYVEPSKKFPLPRQHFRTYEEAHAFAECIRDGSITEYESQGHFNAHHGAIDVYADRDLYEIKTTSSLDDAHVLQVLLYMYPLRAAGALRDAYLVNALSKEKLRIEISDADLLRAMKIVNHYFVHECTQISDEEFLAQQGSHNIDEIITNCKRCVGKFRCFPERDRIADMFDQRGLAHLPAP